MQYMRSRRNTACYRHSLADWRTCRRRHTCAWLHASSPAFGRAYAAAAQTAHLVSFTSFGEKQVKLQEKDAKRIQTKTFEKKGIQKNIGLVFDPCLHVVLMDCYLPPC